MTLSEKLRQIERWTSGQMKPGSTEELEVRRMVARQLRSSPQGLLLGLINVIDPEVNYPNRPRIIFKRGPGSPPKKDWLRVAAIVQRELDLERPMEAAVRQAMKESHSSRKNVFASFARYKPLLKMKAVRKLADCPPN